MTPFATIRARAEARKGGAKVLRSLLPPVMSAKALGEIGDDRFLAEMARRVFSAGFVWRVIEQKWPGFEQAFLGFSPKALGFQPDDFWEALARDSRIVRNPQKIASVRANAAFVDAVSREHGGFGRFLASWPASDHVGLIAFLGKRGSRLGGMTGQYFLRFIGKDGFVTSPDVVTCLRDAGLDIAAPPTAKKDLARVQSVFDAWARETGLSYTHLSRICAMSIGENHSAEALRGFMGLDE